MTIRVCKDRRKKTDGLRQIRTVIEEKKIKVRRLSDFRSELATLCCSAKTGADSSPMIRGRGARAQWTLL